MSRYLQWPLFRGSGVAALGGSVTPVQVIGSLFVFEHYHSNLPDHVRRAKATKQ